MTLIEAALKVLRSSRRPLTTAELTERILTSNLVTLTGRTPEQSLAAALYRALGRYPELVREAEAGPSRARRGSVRWTVRSPQR